MSSIFMMAMSLRKDSYNKKLIQNAHRLLKASGVEADVHSFNDYPMSIYNADDETKEGIPSTVQTFAKKISEARAVIISTPEYNGSIPGPFKNAFDWVSRVKPMPWEGKHVLFLGASPGALGATRSLWHCRQPFEAAGSFVFPEMMGLSAAHEAFDAEGNLKDAKQEQRLDKLLHKFSEHISRFNS